MGKAIGILQPSYLPWLGYLEQIAHCDEFVLYDDVQYDKGGWRNRNRIKSASGPLWLTVPVLLKGTRNQLLRDVRIDNTQPWGKKHLKTISQYYSKAPHYNSIFPSFESLLALHWDYLVELNEAVLVWLCSQIGITTPLVMSSKINVGGDRVERLIKIVEHFGGEVFYEGAAGRDYIPSQQFMAHGIQVVFQDYGHPIYPQQHGAFISHLSAIDLLFNCGPGSKDILLKQAGQNVGRSED